MRRAWVRPDPCGLPLPVSRTAMFNPADGPLDEKTSSETAALGKAIMCSVDDASSRKSSASGDPLIRMILPPQQLSSSASLSNFLIKFNEIRN